MEETILASTSFSVNLEYLAMMRLLIAKKYFTSLSEIFRIVIYMGFVDRFWLDPDFEFIHNRFGIKKSRRNRLTTTYRGRSNITYNQIAVSIPAEWMARLKQLVTSKYLASVSLGIRLFLLRFFMKYPPETLQIPIPRQVKEDIDKYVLPIQEKEKTEKRRNIKNIYHPN